MLSETDISSEHNSGGLFLDSSEPEGQIVTSLYGAFHFLLFNVLPMIWYVSLTWGLVTNAVQ